MEAHYYQQESAATMDGSPDPPPIPCTKGHRPTEALATVEGGSICLICFAALLSDPASPSHHVSYALSQLALASRTPAFIRDLRAFHAHLLAPPLVQALCASDDEALARQIIDLVSDLCAAGDAAGVSGDFVARIADRLSASALPWSSWLVYTLHCFGVLLNSDRGVGNLRARITNRDALFSNLVDGLQLPSEEIRGEILFVLYKLAVLQAMPWDDTDSGSVDSYSLSTSTQQMFCLSLEALLKTENNDVRMNCIALLTVFARKGFFEDLFANDKTSSDGRAMMQTEGPLMYTPLIRLFADAIKGPLLSSDIQVQISTLDLVFCSLSSDRCASHIQDLVEESIADYVFEILRRSGNNDALVISCLQVLTLLAKSEVAFRQRLAVGFPTLLSILNFVADIPLHPVQPQVLKLVLSCIPNCSGIISISQVEEICLALTRILRRYVSGEPGLLPETFTLACSTFVEILKSPSASNIQKLTPLIQDASRNAVVSSLSLVNGNSNKLLLYALYLLEETHIYSQEECSDTNSESQELETSIIETCKNHLLPWLGRIVDEGKNEEEVLGVLETFHVILLRGSANKTQNFAETLASSSIFSLSFGCLGLFPSDQMKSRVYLMLGSIIDRVLGQDFGEPIRDAYEHLPSDPLELIFLLGQRSIDDPDLYSCQCAVILMLYVTSLFDERLADDHQVLASLEQYILVNSRSFSSTVAKSKMLTQLVHAYSFLRGAQINHTAPYSAEAEKALFNLMTENEWELISIGIHPTSLKWLFQQELVMTPLAYHMLDFCRLYSRHDTQVSVHAKTIHLLDIQLITELVISGDNCVTSLLVSLLQQVLEEGKDDETIYVVNVIAGIVQLSPDASNQFCLNGIDAALHSVYCSNRLSAQIFLNCSVLLFTVLYSINHKTLSQHQDGEWFGVVVKLIEFLNPKLASNSCGQEEHLTLGILCLILHHSTNQVLKEASIAILVDRSLICAVNNIVRIAIAKGPALIDQDEETSIGESLIFVLLLYYFSIKSSYVMLRGSLDWQDFLQSSKEAQPQLVICIKCHDLCRLIYYGSSVVKLVASECLMELLTIISVQRNDRDDEVRYSVRYLESMMAVTEGLVFYGNRIVARNCGSCLAIILGLRNMGLQKSIKEAKWCRLIMEELALSLAAPGMASESVTDQHKPAVHIAIALLRSEQTPGWMRLVFDTSCISGIIGNLSVNNVSTEMVSLFRVLMSKKYLNSEHVAGLHQLFQVCRNQIYEEYSKEKIMDEFSEVVMPDDNGKVCSLLIRLMLSQFPNADQIVYERFLEEIELFIQDVGNWGLRVLYSWCFIFWVIVM